ncbi:hypothetical protein [Aeromonas veronii]|uniref:hypothetical protein n=1 Tax=Aeromonas veronii TaxID=654 RepID=UPI003A51791E
MNDKVKRLVNFVNSLNDFYIVQNIDGNYKNMGATIIDGILQAGMTYKNCVKPRVDDFLNSYPDIIKTSQFISLFEKEGISSIINWKASVKTERITALSYFLKNEGVETTEEFGIWLEQDENIKKLKLLSGIKCKTADYFRILTGHQTNAVDRHLIAFIERSGSKVSNYQEAQIIISSAARELNIKEALFDHSIWKYMSEAK